MHTIHSGFTVAVEIKDNQSANLRNVLIKLNGNGNGNLSIFNNSETTLFVSGVILPRQYYHREWLPETFVFATTYCGPLADHLSDLIRTNKKHLCELFSYCKHTEGSLVDENSLIYYLKSHSYKSAFNSRYNCITKQDVEKEKKLRHEIENYIDKAQSLHAFDNLSAVEVKTLIQRHIATRGDDYEWAHKPAVKTVLEYCMINRAPIISSFLLLILIAFLWRNPKYIVRFSTLFVAACLLLWVTIYYIARGKHDTAIRPSDDSIRQIAATQIHPILNEMTAAAPLKKGRLRRFFYAFALRIARFIAPFVMKVPTVSSLRWLGIDKSKRLLFISNYANTTDFYVRDFLVGNTPKGVNFMFTHGQGFPDAKMLIKGGITDHPEGYMNAVHTGQHVTDLWYAHEPNLTADIINKNREIRNGLFKQMTEEKAKKWLKLL